MVAAGLLLGFVEFDQIVNAEDGDGGFGGELEALHLAHQRLQHARILVVPNLSIFQIQSGPEVKKIIAQSS